MINKETHQKVLDYHNQQVSKAIAMLKDWNAGMVVNRVERSEWLRIKEGMEAEIIDMVDYTNNFLNQHGLKSVEMPQISKYFLKSK